ncbi:hypothetical protein [Acaryochloris sp. 'Moss Beach']|uniref:hypothetical protein n=1 Tax=Acaryochloris sp. 'Moss Beach' TaxID=2740837 RepID=UPI0028F416CE|nr:hypothetical protein [Acaryochloris sp. 'Moss Beach']
MGEVSKDAVLDFVDELESGEAVALKVSHVEDVGAWVSAICEYLEGVKDAASFVELVRELEMPPVTVLIGLLLGGFRVEQRGEFYSQSLRISQGLIE